MRFWRSSISRKGFHRFSQRVRLLIYFPFVGLTGFLWSLSGRPVLFRSGTWADHWDPRRSRETI